MLRRHADNSLSLCVSGSCPKEAELTLLSPCKQVLLLHGPGRLSQEQKRYSSVRRASKCCRLAIGVRIAKKNAQERGIPRL